MASIRRATVDDAAALSRVHVASWRSSYRGIVPDSYLDGLDAERRIPGWREHLRATEHVLVAEPAGDVVGFASGGAIREPIGGYDAELYAIYLLEKFQRSGVGTSLLIELARRLDEAGFQSMAVWVFEANAAARFYERTGAVRIGEKERELGGVRLGLAAYGWASLRSLRGWSA